MNTAKQAKGRELRAKGRTKAACPNPRSGPQPSALSPQPSRGFTLIELVIVVAVIALLLSTSLLVMGNVLQSAREKATMATIIKVDGMVQQRAEAMQRYLEKSANQATEKEQTRQFLIQANALYGAYPPVPPWTIDNASDQVWAMLTRARKIREVLPQSFVDICGADRCPGTTGNEAGGDPNYLATRKSVPDVAEFGQGASSGPMRHGDVMAFVKAFQSLSPQLNMTKHTPETESSELLYIALTAAESFGVPPVGQDEFSTSEIKDTDGDGLMEFVDGWGRPLRFYRAPTRLLRCGEDAFTGDSDGDTTSPEAAGPAAGVNPLYANLLDATLPALKANDPKLARDPADAFGLFDKYITKALDSSGNAPTAALQFTRKQSFEFWFYTPETHYTMLIVSAGADGQLGLYEPPDANTLSPLDAPTVTPTTPMWLLAQPVLGDPSASPLADNVTNRKR